MCDILAMWNFALWHISTIETEYRVSSYMLILCIGICLQTYFHSFVSTFDSRTPPLFFFLFFSVRWVLVCARSCVCVCSIRFYIICLYLCRSLVPWPYNIFLASKIRNIPMLNGAFAIKIHNHVIWRLHRRYLPFECLATFYRFLIKVWSS